MNMYLIRMVIMITTITYNYSSVIASPKVGETNNFKQNT